ncbi:MAG: DUF3043 domain-containing protein [Nocardioides sp.]
MFFNRKKESEQTTDPSTQSVAKPGGKGRPTPTRREAEAAAKARAKVPRTRKEISEANKRARQESNAKAREAMRGGDERYLPARDRGPMRRFIRDWVDHKLMFLELLIPGLLISMVFGYSGRPNLVSIGSSITFGLLLLGIVDIVLTRIRLRRELAQRFPGESTRGAIYYAVMRGMQVRFLRLPKRQVTIGQPLPDRYR